MATKPQTTNKVGRPLKYKTDKELQLVIDEYFAECDREERPYTVTGLAMACDLDRKALLSYSEKDEFSNTIKKAKEKVLRYTEERLIKGGNSATGCIFSLKNNWGWVDKQEIDSNVNQNITIKVNIDA